MNKADAAHMIQFREIQTGGVEHGCEENYGEADDEGDDGASMVYGWAGRRCRCR